MHNTRVMEIEGERLTRILLGRRRRRSWLGWTCRWVEGAAWARPALPPAGPESAVVSAPPSRRTRRSSPTHYTSHWVPAAGGRRLAGRSCVVRVADLCRCRIRVGGVDKLSRRVQTSADDDTVSHRTILQSSTLNVLSSTCILVHCASENRTMDCCP